MKAKDVKWLKHLDGFQNGDRLDFLPEAPMRRLIMEGLVDVHYPYNPAHKARAVLTEEGRDLIKGEPK